MKSWKFFSVHSCVTLVCCGLMLPVFGSGNSDGDNGNINGSVRNSTCTKIGLTTSSTVTESNGGTVEPTDGGSSLPTGGGVNRTSFGQGSDVYTPGTPMVLPLTPGKEYTAVSYTHLTLPTKA